MNCMKCGVELKNSGVFCPECLAVMEKYPVNPNVLVKLPNRITAAPAKKKKRAKVLKPEEQVRQLKKANRWLVTLLILALLAWAACAFLLIHLSDGSGNGIFDFGIGQNYDTEEPVDSTDGT